MQLAKFIVLLGIGWLTTIPAIATYHCFGQDISIVVSGYGWNASYEGHVRSGQIYLGSNKVDAYQREAYIAWRNSNYIYQILLAANDEPYRVQVYAPNGRRIVNKSLNCSWQN
ncbi:hypothetical protein TI05_02810 [Achromatium sp. WMS3]|nr:hypothetical protein TI05_02810 [Achromatium sp. WMS3]